MTIPLYIYIKLLFIFMLVDVVNVTGTIAFSVLSLHDRYAFLPLCFYSPGFSLCFCFCRCSLRSLTLSFHPTTPSGGGDGGGIKPMCL